MAVAVTNRVASGNNGGGSSYVTGSFTPNANRLVLVTIFLYRSSGTIIAPTVTGNGITYTEVNRSGTFSQGSDPAQTFVFRGMSASPSAGGITISSTGAEWVGASVDEANGVDTGGTNGSAAIVQSAVNQNNSGGTLTCTLGAFGSVNNGTFGGVNSYGSALKTQGTGFSELTDGTDSPETQWRADNDTTVDWSSLASAGGGVAIELKASGGNQSFSYTGSGGLSFSGAATKLRARLSAPAGGLTLAGAAAQLRVAARLPTGGLTFAGAATRNLGRQVAATGGFALLGTAAQIRVRKPAPAGGLTFSGAVTYSSNNGSQSFSYTAAGGLSLSGTAGYARAVARMAAGGLSFSGAASVSEVSIQRLTVTPSGGISFAGTASYQNSGMQPATGRRQSFGVGYGTWFD